MMEMTAHSVYGLYDESGIRYVGVTSVPLEKRLKEHFREKSSRNHHKHNWLQKHKTQVQIKAIAVGLSEAEAYSQEVELIAKLTNEGVALLNKSFGGEHAALGVKRSVETKAKVAKARAGKKHSLEARLKIRASSKASIPICRIDANGSRQFASAREASRVTGIPWWTIYRSVHSGRKTRDGSRWMLTCNSVVLNENMPSLQQNAANEE